jgi:hypothetical protein
LQPGLPENSFNVATSETSIRHGTKARTAQRTTADILNLTSGNLWIVGRNALIKSGVKEKNNMCVRVSLTHFGRNYLLKSYKNLSSIFNLVSLPCTLNKKENIKHHLSSKLLAF